MEFTLVESKKKNYLKKTISMNMNSSNTNTSTNQSITNNQSNSNQSNSNQSDYEKKILTQEEMTEVLISKIRNNDNVDIKTKEINKEKGLFYAINVRADLSKIGNGLFHSAKINTVSHINRVVNIKMVFSDNETLHHDMKVNVDSLFQCFREIAPDTITNIHIETFKDQIDNEHLCIILSTIKGSSLTYVYKRMIDFVHVINEKYGSLPPPKFNKVSINDIADEMIAENNVSNNSTSTSTSTSTTSTETTIPDITSTSTIPKTIMPKSLIHKTTIPEMIIDEMIIDKTIIPEIIKQEKIIVKEKEIKEIKDNKTIINNSILNVIENLEKEEKRLLLELDNVRKLITSQTSILEISQSQSQNKSNKEDSNSNKGKANPNPIPNSNPNLNSDNSSNKTSFAYKVMHGLSFTKT